MLELESSTAAKFSRHLIVHLPGYGFADNSELGCFVAAVLSSAAASVPADAASAQVAATAGLSLVVQKVR